MLPEINRHLCVLSPSKWLTRHFPYGVLPGPSWAVERQYLFMSGICQRLPLLFEPHPKGASQQDSDTAGGFNPCDPAPGGFPPLRKRGQANSIAECGFRIVDGTEEVEKEPRYLYSTQQLVSTDVMLILESPLLRGRVKTGRGSGWGVPGVRLWRRPRAVTSRRRQQFLDGIGRMNWMGVSCQGLAFTDRGPVVRAGVSGVGRPGALCGSGRGGAVRAAGPRRRRRSGLSRSRR